MSERAELRARLRRARAMTFTVYGLRAGCALLLAWPVLAGLGPALGAADMATLVEAGARSGTRWLLWALGVSAGYALLSPLVSLAWLSALAREQSIAASFARAMAAYLPALALAGAALAAWAVSLCMAGLALTPAAAGLLPETATFERAWTAVALAVAACAGLSISTAHDLSRARLSLGAPLRAALGFGLRALAPALLVRHALLATLAAALLAAADVSARAPFGGESVWAPLALQMALVLAATLVRGTWLAVTLLVAERPTRPRS